MDITNYLQLEKQFMIDKIGDLERNMREQLEEIIWLKGDLQNE